MDVNSLLDNDGRVQILIPKIRRFCPLQFPKNFDARVETRVAVPILRTEYICHDLLEALNVI